MFQRRLLLLTESFPPEVGGVQQYLSGLWSALPAESSAVIAPRDGAADAWDRAQSYRIVRTSMRGLTYPRWRPALRTLEEEIGRFLPDALVCGKALFEGRAALAVQRAQRLPFAVITYAMEIRTWLQHWIHRRDLLAVLAAASRVVVINTEIKKLLLAHGVPDAKIVKIYPGVEEHFFHPAASGRPETRRGEEVVLISTCRLIRRKGVDVVLKALPSVLKAFPAARYRIVGAGPEAVALKHLASQLGVANAVEFLGEVVPDALRDALSSADLFVLTPREVGTDLEGFGIVYLEAAAQGLCAVGSRTGGVPEAVLHDLTGLLVPPDDPHATAEAIIRLLNDGELRSRLARAARERAVNEFSWSRRALLFQGMMEAMVQEERRGRRTTVASRQP